MLRTRQIGFSGLLITAVLMCSCAAPGQVSINNPQGNRVNYPLTFETPATRPEEVQEAWKSFLAEPGLPFSKLDLEPVLNTPRSLPPELAGRIIVSKKGGVFGEMEAKQALRGFIERTLGILCGDPKNTPLSVNDLSLVSFTNGGNSYRFVYRQMTYSFPIAGGFGELTLTVDKKAGLLQWSSRLIPKFDLPNNPSIRSEEIVEKLINREFTYTTIAGRTQTYKVTKSGEIVIKELFVYPVVEGNKLTVHLAYSVEVGNGMTWTVYIDAINGERLGEKQNFVS